MDLRTVLPPEQTGKTLATGTYSAFGLSLQGASHSAKEVPVPCQDYSDFRHLEQGDLYIAAIADGVGSCELSHWGSYTAVTTVLDSVEASFKAKKLPRKLTLDAGMSSQLKEIMVKAFRDAVDAVERKADEGMALPALFMSTLTLAIYDGENLYFGHIGDDGIVVQLDDGHVEMLTARIKGEEASSVYPLQSSESKWRFGRSAGKVAGFIMATDGVLDAFVANHADYFNVNYNKGVYYPFMKDAMEILGSGEEGCVNNALELYRKYLLSEEYRKLVTDDLTFVAVVSNQLMKTARKPRFSTKIWETVHTESNLAKRLALRRQDVPVEGLNGKTVQSSGSSGADAECQRLLEENARLQQTVDQLRQGAGASKPGGHGKKILRVVAGAAAAALILGMAAGTAVFVRDSKDDYRELQGINRTYEQEKKELSEEVETLSGKIGELTEELDAAKQQGEALQAGAEEAEARLLEQEEVIRLLKEKYKLTDEDIAKLIQNEQNKQMSEFDRLKSVADGIEAKAEEVKLAAEEAQAAAEAAKSADDVDAAKEAAALAEKASQMAADKKNAAEELLKHLKSKSFVKKGNRIMEKFEGAEDLVKKAEDWMKIARNEAEDAKEAWEEAAEALNALQMQMAPAETAPQETAPQETVPQETAPQETAAGNDGETE